MNYRIDKQGLYDSLSVWNGFLKRKVNLIACGGTALTLLDVERFKETASYDVLEEMVLKNLAHFLRILKKEEVHGGQ